MDDRAEDGTAGRCDDAGTARRWNALVLDYASPGSDRLLDELPDRIGRPLDPGARRERSRIDGLVTRQAALTTGAATGALGALGGAAVLDSPALALAALAATATGVVTAVRWRRLHDRRAALSTGGGQDTRQLTRFSRWLVACAHQAVVRASEVEGGPADTADRMAEALCRFTEDVRALERTIGSASAVADTYGRLRQVRDRPDRVRALLDAEAHLLRALELFGSTAREVVLAARAERASGEPAGVVPSLLDLQAEALARGAALAALDAPVSPR
jgi:hypothetical protein